MPGNAKQSVSRRIGGADACVCRAAAQNNYRNVDQRFDVVDDRGLMKQPALRGKRRLVARLSTVALNGIEQRCFFTADVRARAAANFDVQRKSAAQNAFTQQVLRARRPNRVSQPLRR